MPAELDRQQQANGSSPRRLKLVMPQNQASSENSPQRAIRAAENTQEHSGSPTRPSYSPVTPTFSQSALAIAPTQPHTEQRELWVTEPEALPVSLDDNPDAIAMRAAISILQLQRQQSLKDIKDLENLRKSAVQETETFVNDLKDGKLTPQPRTGIDVDEDDSDSDSQSERLSSSATSKFGKFPAPQNVVRAPPVEWSKYHIVGEPLDRMHEIQRRYPGFKEEMLEAVQKPQPHSIASPYKPFADKLDDP